MLKIRLQRIGKKHEPVFRVVVGQSQNGPKSGKFIEVIGSYDPRGKNTNTLNKERVNYWVERGAQVSDTVHNLLVDEKVFAKKKINALPKKTAPKKEAVAEETPAEETPAPAEEATESTEAPVTEAESTPETPEAETSEEAPTPEETPAEEPKA